MIFIDSVSETVIKELPTSDKVVIVDVKGTKNNPIFTYKIPVKIDLRTALRLNISDFSVNVLNRPLSQTQNSQFLDVTAPGERQFPPPSLELNNQINNFSEQEMIRHFNARKRSIISTVNLDFKEILDNQVMSRFANLTDAELFGDEEIVVVAESALDTNNSKDLTITLNDPNVDNETVSFNEAVDALYQEGGDPASAFTQMQDELSFKQSEQGLTINYAGFKKNDSYFQNLKSIIRNTFISETTIDESSGQDLNALANPLGSSRLKTFRIKNSLRIQEVNFYVDVSQTLISETGGLVHLAITCYDMFGLIIDIRELNLMHASFADDLTVFVPKLSVEANRSGVNKDTIVLSVANESEASINANVYYKVTSECGSLDKMRFVFSKQLILGGKETKRIKYSSIDIDGTSGPSTGGSVLFRVTPEIMTYESNLFRNIDNTYYARVTSPYLERNVFVPIITYNKKHFVEVAVYKLPNNAKYVQIVKRNVTLNERKFKPVKDEIGSVYPLIRFADGTQSVSLDDYDVKDENVYEYKAQINYGGGEDIQSINSTIHEYLEIDDVVKLDASDVSLNAEGEKVINVKITKTVTPADKLFDQIAAFAKQPKGVEVGGVANPAFSLFKPFFDQINSTILEAVILRVIRVNTTTGKFSNLDEFNVEFNQSSSVVGSATIIDPNGCNTEEEYVYIIQPFIRSVFDLLVEIKTKLKEMAKQSNIPGRNLVAQLMRTVNQGIESETGGKFYSRLAYKQGTLQSKQQSVEEVNGDLWLYGRNGNISYVFYQHTPLEFKLSTKRVSLIKAVRGLAESYQKLENSPVLAGSYELPPPITPYTGTVGEVARPVLKSAADSFLEDIVKLDFTIDGDPDEIDYFVITGMKNGQSRIVGSMHCPDNNRISYTFIDDSQVGYQGAINYSLYAVSETKKIMGPFTLGVAILGSGV